MAAKNLPRLALPLLGALLFAGAATAQPYDHGYDYGGYRYDGYGYERGYERGSYEARAYENDGRGWRETYRDGDAWHSDYGYDDDRADYAPPPCDWRCGRDYGHGYGYRGGEVALSDGFFYSGLTGGVGPSWGGGGYYRYGGRGVIIVNSSASASASAYAYANARSSVSISRSGGGCCR
ncbi:hypothetical protein [Caulobacter mirabilis]|uniref:Uncharacterized protein n=1 Tax=Caulobacter mirabilis TaxID=69666 RepID=A0A2D2B354_9CAUL|nr:hypothetical protein [Caulobacter mirabilis]ATQ44685.1 hypothetical protein CSW64_20990 [Caulobacter mirabilis]